MKVRVALKKRCKDCQFVRRKGKLRVICKTNKRHKQRQPFHTMIAAGAQTQISPPTTAAAGGARMEGRLVDGLVGNNNSNSSFMPKVETALGGTVPTRIGSLGNAYMLLFR